MPGKPARSGPRPFVDLTRVRSVSLRAYLVRFALGAAVSVVAGVIGHTAGPRLGGLFLAFPAILPAGLTLIQDQQGSRVADRNAVGAVLGGAGLVIFAAVGEGAFTRVPAVLALLLALLAWCLASAGLYALLALLRPQECDAARD